MPLFLNAPLKGASLSEKVCQLIRRQIIEGQLTPGEKLNIFALAEQMQISRTPIKEAFNRLAEDGMLSIRPQKGTFVSTLSESEVSQLFDVRLMIELWGIRRLCAVESRLEQISSILEGCKPLLASSDDFDYLGFVERDRLFHEEIVAAAANPQLTKIYRRVYPHMQLLRAYWGRARERAARSHEQHMQVLAALREWNGARAEEALTEHLLSSRDDILRLLRDEEHPLVNMAAEAGRGVSRAW